MALLIFTSSPKRVDEDCLESTLLVSPVLSEICSFSLLYISGHCVAEEESTAGDQLFVEGKEFTDWYGWL